VEILGTKSCLPLLFEPNRLEKFLMTAEPRGYARLLGKWLQQSMLPEPNLLDDLEMAQEILQAYQATYLENEIRRENLVEDIGRFEQFLALAAAEDTQIVDYASKARVLGVSPHTIKTYYGILEDTFVCKRINAYSGSLRVQLRKNPKIYFSDTGLARFISGERGLPKEGSSQFGKLIEGFVVMEIVKQLEYSGLPWKLSYLRAKSGMEIDLIVSNKEEKIAIEIKASRKTSAADYQSLKTLMKLDKQVKHGIVFSLQPAPFRLENNIFNVPVWNL
jgi:predicted AAA+ superfamily ATPase